MPTIHLTTFIAAPPDRVFDLSRSIDLHKKSLTHTREEAIAGTITGLLELNESVTWKAKHLGKTRFLKSKLTEFKKPDMFTDEMLQGDFKKMKHQHHFKQVDNGTIMIDIFEFESPFNSLGRFFNRLYLTSYLRKVLEQRNLVIKEFAETEKWKQLLNK
ncbi:MAG TPA: SRPBCC family protein [Chitinophagaceae bacterium]|nr:SRPBCC family protein [Chitinophagaceae bacterium]